MWRKILNVSVIILTVIIAGLQLLPKAEADEHWLMTWLRGNALTIALICGGIVILLHVIDVFLTRYENRKEWLRRLLRYIVNKHLGGDNYQSRVSIMRTRKGWQIIIPYLYDCFVRNFVNNFKKHQWKVRLYNIPIHLATKYLVIFVRDCYPNKDKSTIHIRVTEHPDVYNGIAEKCFREGMEQIVDTLYVNNIEINTPLFSKTDSKIKRYMNDCMVDEAYYLTVANMATKANHIFAVPVQKDDRTIWGVLIADVCLRENYNYTEDAKDALRHYAELISYTISVFNS